jgi:hypothetical protein
MTGSYAANAHEGSRSEYLAQYVFAALGTVVPVPHHEDHGIDLYCTLTERIGQRAWPLAYYTVQVKSNDQPWTFEGPRSVEWLLEQPLPLFVCTVDKKQARLRVFRTDVRFASNFLQASSAGSHELRPDGRGLRPFARGSHPGCHDQRSA